MTEREQFEKVFPVPVSMVWNGFTYAIVDAHEISSCWDYQLRWETWQAARATPALPQGVEEWIHHHWVQFDTAKFERFVPVDDLTAYLSGMAIVPVEPTGEMIDAAERVDWSESDTKASIINMWQAMLAAAKEKNDE